MPTFFSLCVLCLSTQCSRSFGFLDFHQSTRTGHDSGGGSSVNTSYITKDFIRQVTLLWEHRLAQWSLPAMYTVSPECFLGGICVRFVHQSKTMKLSHGPCMVSVCYILELSVKNRKYYLPKLLSGIWEEIAKRCTVYHINIVNSLSCS